MKNIYKYGLLLSFAALLLFANRNKLKHYSKPVYRAHINNSEHIWGIDISHHQTKVDWDKLVKHNKPEFIFLKCTEGLSFKDNKYNFYKKEATKREIVVGAYHFFSFKTSGKKQAEYFIKHSNLDKGDLIPVIDVEYPVKGKVPSKSKIAKEINAFSKVIEHKLGVKPIIYTGEHFYNRILKGKFRNHKFWISKMNREPNCNYSFWQYTDRGYVKGIGRVDNNRMKRGENLEKYILN